MCFSVVLPFVVIILWLGGLRLGELTIKETTTQGIWRSGRNALLVGLPIFLIVLVGASIGWYYAFNPSRGLKAETVIDKMIYFFPLALGIIAGVVAGLISGGDTFVRHFILRFLLYRKHCIPWNITRFLDYAAERILLQKVGGGYIFIHRYLLEYFAGLDLTKK